MALSADWVGSMWRRSSILIAVFAVVALPITACADDGGGGQERSAESGAEARGGQERSAESGAEARAGQQKSAKSGASGDRGGDSHVRAGGRGGEVAQIKRVVVRFIKTQDPAATCRVLTTRRLVERIWGGVRECEKFLRRAGSGEPARAVNVSNLRVAHSVATARIDVTDGDFGGVKASLALRKERSRWRVDEIADLFRATIYRSAMRRLDGNSAARPGIRSCVRKTIYELSEKEIGGFLRSSSESAAAGRLLRARLRPCLNIPGRGEVSAARLLRKRFESELQGNLRKIGIGPAGVECVIRRTRSSVTDEYLLEALRRLRRARDRGAGPPKSPPRPIVREVRLAVAACSR